MSKAAQVCIRGHEKTDANIYKRKDGSRECKECAKLRDKNRYPNERERRIADATRWGKENPEAFRAIQRKQDRRPEVKERRSAFYQETKSEPWRKYSHLKSFCKFNNRDLTLSEEDYIILTIANECHYCKNPLPIVGYGLDRQNNKIGYVHGNVVPCCESCNEKKGRLEGLGFAYPRTVELLMELLQK